MPAAMGRGNLLVDQKSFVRHAECMFQLDDDASAPAVKTVTRYGHWIGGTEFAPTSGAYMTSASPWDGTAVAEIALGDASDVDAAVASAAVGFAAWREVKPGARGKLLSRIADGLRANSRHLAALEGAEAGKPGPQSVREIE